MSDVRVYQAKAVNFAVRFLVVDAASLHNEIVVKGIHMQ